MGLQILHFKRESKEFEIEMEDLMEQNVRPFGWRDKTGYMFGDFGNDFTFILSSMFLLKFYTHFTSKNCFYCLIFSSILFTINTRDKIPITIYKQMNVDNFTPCLF